MGGEGGARQSWWAHAPMAQREREREREKEVPHPPSKRWPLWPTEVAVGP